MNEILASETEDGTALRSEDLGLLRSRTPAQPCLSLQPLPTPPTKKLLHGPPHLLSRNAGLTLRGDSAGARERSELSEHGWTPDHLLLW